MTLSLCQAADLAHANGACYWEIRNPRKNGRGVQDDVESWGIVVKNGVAFTYSGSIIPDDEEFPE